jgi:hypothetical protein
MLEAIRPFQEYNSADGLESAIMGEEYGNGGFRTVHDKTYKFDGGSVRLDKHGVLNYENGFVNIAPKAKIVHYFNNKEDDKDEKTVSIKRCMFSIENLAWKGGNKGSGINEFDPMGLSAEQKGPLGGRIMWFPPYDLKFSENTRADWNENAFIGRGEKIFTYTNTSRSGNLSFKLLIDHPSVIDYWAEKNKESSYSGVDDINSNESKLLRFFAGCDILKAAPQKYLYKSAITKLEEEKKEEKRIERSEPAPETTTPQKRRMFCFVFYPNNYSGKDDGGIVDPIHYLLNGIGTQKIVNSNKDATDFAVNMENNVSTTTGNGYGGYEMRNGKGISIVSEPINMNYETIKSTFSDLVSKKRKAQYLTDKNGQTIDVAEGTLAKQVSIKSDSLGSAKGNGTGGCSTLVTKNPHTWYRKRWYYRVDKDTEPQDLLHYDNYIDKTSFGLNSKSGLEEVKRLASSQFQISFTKDDYLVSLTDMYMALEKGNENVFNGLYDDDNVALINELVSKENLKITSIKFYGHASSHNNTTDAKREARNTSLAKNRYLTFKSWLKNHNFPDIDKEVFDEIPGVEKGGKDGDINDEIKKFWRSAHVVIEYESSQEEPGQTTESKTQKVTEKDKNGNTRIVDSPVVQQVSPTSVKVGVSEAKQIGLNSELPKSDMTGIEIAEKIDKVKNQVGDIIESTNSAITYEIKSDTVKRYDNEGEFFKMLEKNEPFLHHLISEKIKYFDPAFHSISPEGFNARLTFLHQCTRQGPTVGASDTNNLTAYNLAFGRPPVCVLRIGDFYYTKIIIRSVDIDYGDMQWDLNPEGIGVMPMMADIKINFEFIGGSDLAGPIARLQNAVSFNYYANTGVYDNRAEMVEYSNDKSGKEIKYKPFVYPTIKAPNDDTDTEK